MTACDCCRKRKIKCDGRDPCSMCVSYQIPCSYNAVPQRRGPRAKRDSVIEKLRRHNYDPGSAGRSAESPTSPELASQFCWDRYPRPLLEELVFEYFHSLHVITPILDYHKVLDYLDKKPTATSYCIIMGICAVAMRSSRRKNLRYPIEDSRQLETELLSEAALAHDLGRFINDICIETIMCSYFLFAANFRGTNFRPAWYYLREAITMLQLLRIDKEEHYVGLDADSALQHRALFFVLYVTERGASLHAEFPLTLKNTIEYPEYGPKLQRIYGCIVHMAKLFTVVDELKAFLAVGNSSRSTSVARSLLGKIQEARAYVSKMPFDIQKADFVISTLWLRMLLLKAVGHSTQIALLESDVSKSIVEDLDVIATNMSKKSIEVHGVGMGMKLADILRCLSEINGVELAALPSTSELLNDLEDRISALLDRINTFHTLGPSDSDSPDDNLALIPSSLSQMSSPSAQPTNLFGQFILSKDIYSFGLSPLPDEPKEPVKDDDNQVEPAEIPSPSSFPILGFTGHDALVWPGMTGLSPSPSLLYNL